MAPSTEFTPIFKPRTRPLPGDEDPLSPLLKDAFTIPQLFLVGALLQVVLQLLLPARYAIIPTLLLLLHTVTSVALQSTSPSRNTFLRGSIFRRATAQMPPKAYDPATPAGPGLFPARPASTPLVVLHLGVRYNHPLGPLAPGAMATTKRFMACTKELEERGRDFGCVGQSTYLAASRAQHNTLLAVFYFRDVEGLNAFAHDKVHREAWDWFIKVSREGGYEHLGIYHETFVAQAGSWETIYVNMPPVLFGAAEERVKNEESGQEEFVSTLVDADHMAMRSQYGRMNRGSDGEMRGQE